ncbi:MAG: glycosyltransferase family 9 protein [Candidatus Protochlamydia sp.]|nr:glycosyltransferase family 9 protein [Candidatus Protochlamydia sp.]
MKILIIKTSSLGDIIHAFPVLDYLRTYYPEAQIDWVVERSFKELLEAHPLLTNVFSIETKKWRRNFLQKKTWGHLIKAIKQIRGCYYDYIFDLQGNTKSGLCTAFARSKYKIGFGKKTVSEWPNLLFTHLRFDPPPGYNIRDDYLFIVQNTIQKSAGSFQGVELKIDFESHDKINELLEDPKLQGGPKIMVCPGSHWINKRLSKETLHLFLNQMHIQIKARFLFIWGSLDEKEICEELSAYFKGNSLVPNRFSFSVLQNLMSNMDLVLSMDSLPLHLAGTTSTPTYSFFGPSLAVKYRPEGPKHFAFQGACPYGKIFNKRCPVLRTCQTGSCLKDVDALLLFQHFIKWWQELQKR